MFRAIVLAIYNCFRRPKNDEPPLEAVIIAPPTCSSSPNLCTAPSQARQDAAITSGRPEIVTVEAPPAESGIISCPNCHTRIQPKLKNPPDTLISLEQFMKMPLPIWLTILNQFSPLDMLNLAAAHPFFKDFITRAPKRWGKFMERHIVEDYYVEEAKAYKLTRTRTWWEDERKTLLAYGNEYGVAEARYKLGPASLRRWEGNRCTHVPPEVDRDEAAARDLFLLFNNATFDQLGVGPRWKLPGPDKYKVYPAVRARTVMLSSPNKEHYAQMAQLEPQCVTLDVGNDGAGKLRAAVRKVTSILPGLQKLWLLIPYKVAEIAMLVDVKTPAITAQFALLELFIRGLPANPDVLKQLNNTLETTLNTLIEQWQRREREIDNIALIALWKMVSAAGLPSMRTNWTHLCPGTREMPAKLCEGKTDPHYIKWVKESHGFWLIRRGPGSRDGLLIGVKGPSFLLISCDYNFRRSRTHEECAAFFAASNKAQEEIKAAFAGDDPLDVEANRWPKKNRRTITDRFAATERAELALKEWSKKAPYNSLPTREKAIDRLFCGPVLRGSSGESFTPTMEFEPPEDQVTCQYPVYH